MKIKISILCSVLAVLLLATACYKDLGNYDYTPPEEPVVTLLEDTIYTAFIGDILSIKPGIKHSLVGTDELSYQWKIAFPYPPFEIIYNGPVLEEVFTLSPGIYNGLFTITDNTRYLAGCNENQCTLLVIVSMSAIQQITAFNIFQKYCIEPKIHTTSLSGICFG